MTKARAMDGDRFQARVEPWLLECFGAEIAGDKLERGDRLLEEVLELLQSGDYPPDRVAVLTDYVWGRSKGEPSQEVGGTMVTLAAYCWAHGLDAHEAAETELARITQPAIIEKIRAKQAAKPTESAASSRPAPNHPDARGDGSRPQAAADGPHERRDRGARRLDPSVLRDGSRPYDLSPTVDREEIARVIEFAMAEARLHDLDDEVVNEAVSAIIAMT